MLARVVAVWFGNHYLLTVYSCHQLLLHISMSPSVLVCRISYLLRPPDMWPVRPWTCLPPDTNSIFNPSNSISRREMFRCNWRPNKIPRHPDISNARPVLLQVVHWRTTSCPLLHIFLPSIVFQKRKCLRNTKGTMDSSNNCIPFFFRDLRMVLLHIEWKREPRFGKNKGQYCSPNVRILLQSLTKFGGRMRELVEVSGLSIAPDSFFRVYTLNF